MKSKSCTAATSGTPSTVPAPSMTASSRPVLALRRLQPLGVAPLVAEAERIDGDGGRGQRLPFARRRRTAGAACAHRRAGGSRSPERRTGSPPDPCGRPSRRSRGHLTQRFSGVSRLVHRPRIFGRTTLEIQFTPKTPIPPPSAARRARPAQAPSRSRPPLQRFSASPGSPRRGSSRSPRRAPSRPRRRRRCGRSPPPAPAWTRRSRPRSAAIGVPLDAFHRRRDAAGIRRRRAGDAGDRHVIDEARRVPQHRRQPLVVGGRRREADEVEPRLHRRQAELVVGLRRQIDDDQPVDAGRLCVGDEARARRRYRSDCNSPSARSASRNRARGRRARAPAS